MYPYSLPFTYYHLASQKGEFSSKKRSSLIFAAKIRRSNSSIVFEQRRTLCSPTAHPKLEGRFRSFSIIARERIRVATKQPSRIEQDLRDELLTITNMTRVNSAIRSYCSRKQREPGFVDCAGVATRVCPWFCTPKKETDSISIHLFSPPFH